MFSKLDILVPKLIEIIDTIFFILRKVNKRVSRSLKSKKKRKYNDQRTNNDLQNTTQKTRDRATRTVTEYGTALTTILPILFLYLNAVVVIAEAFEP